MHHGTLVGFETDDSHWKNSLDSPQVIQTALLSWAMGSNILPFADKFESLWELFGGTISESGTRLDGRPAILFTENDADEIHLLKLGAIFIAGHNKLKARVKDAGRGLCYLQAYNSTDSYVFRVKLDFITESLDVLFGDGSFIKLEDGWFEITAWGDSTVDGSSAYVGEVVGTVGIDGPAIYIDGVYGANGEIGAGVLTADAPATRALVPVDPWNKDYQFLRDHGELNWNGRSYADAGNGADVNARTALIVECVISVADMTLNSFVIGKDGAYTVLTDSANIRFGVTTDTFVDIPIAIIADADKLTHFLMVYGSGELKVYADGILVGTVAKTGDIVTNSNQFTLSSLQADSRPVGKNAETALYIDDTAQAIIDSGMDEWALNRYNLLLPIFWSVTNDHTVVQHNGENVYFVE